MTETIFTVISNGTVSPGIFVMKLSGDTSDIIKPGQFVNVKVDGAFLRRPISVCDAEENVLTLVYRVVGDGAGRLSRTRPFDTLNLLTGLGNGYDTSVSGERPLLVGGGVGVPPLYMLCKKLISEGKSPSVILGFNTESGIFLESEFRALGVPVTVTTADGSYGIKGTAADAMACADYTYFYTCGPMPMFRAIERVAVTGGQFSFEERMGCGFGACMGCTCKTKYGDKRICRDGPILMREEIIW